MGFFSVGRIAGFSRLGGVRTRWWHARTVGIFSP